MSISCALLMCHAPIVLPEIARERARECENTTRAMREAARTLVEHEPDAVVLISPHTPRHRLHWGICRDATLHGSFTRFGHGELSYEFIGARAQAETLERCARERALGVQPVSGRELDHGALVPLHFLREAGYRGPVLLVALPYPGGDSEREFGRAVRAAAAQRGESWPVLASGDMSHRLSADAPAGYDPAGREFDASFVRELERRDLRSAVSLPRGLLERAAEDAVQSTAVAASAVDYESRGARVFHYEGPFGVGYCEALLYSARARETADLGTRTRSHEPPQALVELALEAIESELDGRPLEITELASPWDQARAVFVTLRSPDGELRGCIGRTEPLTRSLAAEVVDCAIAAATRDPRMQPVTRAELADLEVEVSVLSPPEPVHDRTTLDPQRYGVVVRLGARRGVLLPGIETVDSVERQLAIARSKAGIGADEPYQIERFRVDKVARRGGGHDATEC